MKTTRFAAALLTTGLALGTYAAGGASAAQLPGSIANASSPQAASTTATAGDVDAMADCRSSNEGNWLIPDGSGSWAGNIYWEDHNGDTDQDNIYISDRPTDAQSSSLRVTNHATGKEYYKHVYSGDSYCMGVGNVPNGDYVYWSACGWNEGEIMECKSGTITE